ncbi:MAG: DUF1573 domain-containing protein [bacterium]|nr:DUF1573 domain-containing protein [bacterium]
MNKKIIIGLVLIVLGGLFWLGQVQQKNNNSASSSNNQPSLLASIESSFDFGNISMSAGDVSHVFKIKNTTDQLITIDKIYTSCMCTTATIMLAGNKYGPYTMPGHGFMPRLNKTLTPSEEADIEVIFDPAAHGPAGIGRINRTVYIENGPTVLELSFTATVTP